MVAFLCTLALAISTVGVAALEVDRTQEKTLEIADRDHQVTYYLGDVAEQLARFREQVALGDRDPAGVAEHDRLVAQIDVQLETDLHWLSGGIDASLAERWKTLAASIDRLRRVYLEGALRIGAGQVEQGARLLEENRAVTTLAHETLNRLQQEHRRRSSEALRLAQQRTTHVRRLEVYLGSGFVAGLLVIWGYVLLRLRSQQRRLAEYTTRIETANADLDAFAGRVAHDLRNALAPVLMAPSMLRTSASDTERVLGLADRVERCSGRAIAILDALLSFSRSSRSGVEGEPGALLPVVRSVIEEIGPRARELDVSVDVDEVPEVRVRCPPALLHVVLSNLCGNAVKYLAGCSERRVRIVARVEGASCRIEVEDTGPGIPKAAQGRIFDPFFRVKGTRAPGTGIGLATVRRIIDACGGRVDLESAEGQGSRFVVRLPVAKDETTPLHSRRSVNRRSA